MQPLVDFFKNLPPHIIYPGKAVAAVVGGYVSQNPQLFPTWAVWAGAAIALWVVLAFLWHVLNYWREKSGRPKLNLDPSVLMILFLAGALVCAVWARFFPKEAAANVPSQHITSSPAKKPSSPKNIEYVSNQDIGAAYNANPSPQPAIQYQGAYNSNVVKHLRVFVDLLEGPNDRPLRYRRIRITELKDFARGQQLLLPIVIREEDENKNWIFRWGESTERFRASNGQFYARLVLIADDGEEQHCYFMVIPSTINGSPYISVIPARTLQFADAWEAQDEKK